ncbi:MAG: peptidylprolyl isomerase [Chitinophagaceae bacterium]
MKKVFTVSLILLVSKVFAQPQKVVADKIIAQVGNKIILKSDIINAISDYKRQGQEASLPPNPECAFLEGQLIQKALILQAERDSLVVSEDEIEAALDNQIRGFIREYGSQQVLEEIAGKTVYQIKEDFRVVFKERKLADLMRAKIVENIKITPNEVKSFYEKIPKDSLSYYESELELQQIIILPKASKDVDEYVMRQLYDYKRQVEAGTKRFEQLAKANTDDPGSKETGGQYNVNRNEKFWDPTFLSTCFKLKEGQISNVIKSKFGYHIIQLVSRSGDDAVVRHILKIPPITEEEIKASINKLDTIKAQLLRKEIAFGDALNKYSDDEYSKNSGGQISGKDGSGFITIDQLDKEMVVLIKTLKPGEYSTPQTYTDDRGQKKVRLVYFKSKTEPHRENLKDDYNKLSLRAVEEKKQTKLETWFKEHLPFYYITIDDEFKECNSLKDWLKFASKG